jgi:hypothetical protein
MASSPGWFVTAVYCSKADCWSGVKDARGVGLDIVELKLSDNGTDLTNKRHAGCRWHKQAKDEKLGISYVELDMQ